MTDVAPGSMDGETPVNPYSLLDAVNRSSDTAHMAWLVFLGIMTYLMIAVAGVTHRDLLLETPVSLPILGVDIQLTQFFQFAPIVLVLFHLGLVSQLSLLARKTLEFDKAIRLLETSNRRTHPLRLELHNFFFVQAMGGPNRSLVMGAILHTMSWLTLVILPVVLILYIQVMFLPYHDTLITWTHRFALLFDIAVLLLIGVFLMRAETSFFQAFWGTSRANPVTFLVTMILLAVVTFFSFFVATVPGETLDRVARTLMPVADSEANLNDPTYYSGFVLPFATGGGDGDLFGIFKRNLVVTDTDLVADRDVSVGEPTMSLRGRDLRFARLDRSDLHQADLTGANLDHASFQGADLRNAWLQCADVNKFLLSGETREERIAAQCTSARNANFSRAKLAKADLTGIDGQFVKFEEANLDGVDLAHAILLGANFSSAQARYANISDVNATGVNFLIASLQGANLKGAKLYGADFTSAGLTAVMLDLAHLEGAKFQGATLDGASLEKAVLWGANFSRAQMTGADLQGAKIWQTVPPPSEGRDLVDYADLDVAAPTAEQIEAVERQVKIEDSAGLSERLGDALSVVLTKSGDRWGQTSDGNDWQSLAGRQGGPVAFGVPSPTRVANAGVSDPVGSTSDPASSVPSNGFGSSGSSLSSYGEQLTKYLSILMCRAQWADGSVARGVVRLAIKRTFKGDLVEIARRLESSSCAAFDAMPKSVMRDLTTATDQLRDN